MKKIVFAISIIATQLLTAQNQDDKSDQVKTVFGNGGGFGGFLEMGVKAGDFNGQSGLLVGGGISAVFSSKMNIGFMGYGLATEIDADTYDPDNRFYKMDMGYGGLLLEPVIGNKHMVHITIPIILGVGGAALREENRERFIEDHEEVEDFEDYHFDSDVFLVAEPGLNIEVNLIKNIRLDFGATYRYVYDSNLEGISDEELSGFTGSVGLKFGWF